MKWLVRITIALLVASLPGWAAAAQDPAASALFDLGKNPSAGMAPIVRLLVGLTFLSFIPAALVAMTSFTRIIVTLSFLRHALGMPETPPNAVLITLALFLTFFTMAPVLEKSHREGLTPFLDGKIESQQALDRGLGPLKTFMKAHVREQELDAVASLAKTPRSADAADPPLQVLVPAFMLSELRAAFVSGFIIFLPFLLIDLVVAAVLMALGMMMVPPVSIALPLKVLLFVLIDGWSLLLRAIAGAYG